MFSRIIFGVIALLTANAAAPAQDRPIFDTHMHYSADAWDSVPVESALQKMKRAGVEWALVSSTPDEGTLKLKTAGGDRIVMVLRPYHDGVTASNWTGRADVVAYLEHRLATRRYVGIGEFHLSAAQTKTDVVRETAALAAARGLFLHVHSGAQAVRELFMLNPELKILWAHAGMSEPAAVVREMVEAYDSLFVELSFRAGDIAPGGRMDPQWRALLTEFSSRFTIGTDTYITPRWSDYEGLIAEHRQWLEQLPSDAADAIANGNARKMFAVGD